MTSNRWFLSGIRCPRVHPKPQLSILSLAKKLPKTYFSVWKSIGRSVVIRPFFSAREINRALGCNPATIFLATSFSVCSWRLFIWLRRAFYLVGWLLIWLGRLFIWLGLAFYLIWLGRLFIWLGRLFIWPGLSFHLAGWAGRAADR